MTATTLERAYGRLWHESRRAFDLECVERVLPLYEARHPGDFRPHHVVEMSRVNAPGLATAHQALYEWSQQLRAQTGDDANIAYHVVFAAYWAAMPYSRGAASSDYVPSAASAATNAIYIAAYARTRDADEAEAARGEERAWQIARVEALVASQIR